VNGTEKQMEKKGRKTGLKKPMKEVGMERKKS
jgi:hypothetical protein